MIHKQVRNDRTFMIRSASDAFYMLQECIITLSCSKSITAPQECGVAKHEPCRLSAPFHLKQPETLTGTLVKTKRFPKICLVFCLCFLYYFTRPKQPRRLWR